MSSYVLQNYILCVLCGLLFKKVMEVYVYRLEIYMSKTVIFSGVCGFTTEVEAHGDETACVLTITSDCPSIQELAEALKQVDPMQEVMHSGEGPLTLRMAKEHCPHTACPVPVGIIKAIEVESGLALPKDVTITVERTSG